VDWSQLSIGVAAIVGLVYVARTMRGLVRETLERVGTIQKESTVFMGNHMSNISSSLESVAVNLSTLNERVDRLHDDNVETAVVAKQVAQNLRISDAKAAAAIRLATRGEYR